MNFPIALPPNLYFPNVGGNILLPNELIYNRRINNGGMIYPNFLGRFGCVPQGAGILDILKKEGKNIGTRLLKQVGKEGLNLVNKYINLEDTTTTEGSGLKRKTRKRKKKATGGARSAKKLREALLL